MDLQYEYHVKGTGWIDIRLFTTGSAVIQRKNVIFLECRHAVIYAVILTRFCKLQAGQVML